MATYWYDVTSQTTAVTTSGGSTWEYWTYAGTDSTTATSATTTWTTWNGTAATSYVYQQPYQQPVLTPEQLAARKAEDEAREARRAVERAAKEAAKERAAALLESVLDAEQRQDLKAKGHFFLTLHGVDKKRFKIHRSTHGNIERVDEHGKTLERWCVQPNGVPTDDAVAAQVLHLRHDYEGIAQRANKTRVA
jgi:hypothetical protein